MISRTWSAARTITLFFSLSAATFAAAVRQDPPDVTWSHTWDFSDGLQGWTITDSSPTPPYLAGWVDPVVAPGGPTLPDGSVSGGGGGNLYLPNAAQARLPIPGANQSRFVLQADVYIPNLSPLTGFPNSAPGNWLHGSGIAAIRGGDDRPVYLRGYVGTLGFESQDRTWDGTTTRSSWLGSPTEGAADTWWDQWLTLRIDYDWSAPGKIRYFVRVPWAWGDPLAPNEAGWYLVADRPYVNPSASWAGLLLGQIPGTSGWTQAQFDNVKFVPEPTGLMLLASVGFLVSIRTKRELGALSS